jgi:hypothetical protein
VVTANSDWLAGTLLRQNADLAQALAAALEAEIGWWADFVVGGDHVAVFAGRVFRYCIGDTRARAEAVAWGGPQELRSVSLIGMTESSGR